MPDTPDINLGTAVNPQPVNPADLEALQRAISQGQPQTPPEQSSAPIPGTDALQAPPPIMPPQQAVQAEMDQRQQQATTPPKPGMRPNFMNLIDAITGKGVVGQQSSPLSRPTSRLDAFEGFIGNFLNSFSAGMANAGTGPAANARGFGAAMQQPNQQAMQQFQMQQQQRQQESENALRQSQARTNDANAEMVQTPYGMMPAKLAAGIFGQAGKGVEAARITGQTRENVQDAKGKTDIEKAKITSGGKARTELQLIGDALGGNTGAQAQLDVLQKRRMQLVQERNKGAAMRPLYQIQKGIDPDTGEITFLTGFQALEAKKEGKNFIPSGPLSARELIPFQRLQSESAPAIKAVRDNIGAFDNESDKAIIARIARDNGSPTYGNESGWLGNVINQSLKGNLSDQGRSELVALGRLNEVMGVVRAAQSLPATDLSMKTTLALLPGASTPNSKYAAEQIDSLEQMIKQATGIPALKSAGGNASKPSASGSSKVDSLANKYGGTKK